MPQASDADITKQLREFGRNLCHARERVGPYQANLATAADYDRSAISRVECARRAPKFRTLLKLARGAQVKPAELLQGIGPADSTCKPPQLTHMKASGPATRFGTNLKWAREHAGFNKEELALEVPADRSEISAYESGSAEPNLRTILRFAHALGIPPALLFHEVE